MALCSCGQQAATQCHRQQCGRCCVGCAKHPRKLPTPGEPGSCECGNVAAPTCENWLCARCCSGCSRHVFATDTESEAESVAAGPRPGEPGSCSCGQVASPACDYALCARCCRGCSRHVSAAESEPQSEYESEAAPCPGEPGSCSCGQIASPACDNALCARCCRGCSRHVLAAESESLPESEPEVAPRPGEPGSCSCGQTASPACDNDMCASCCHGCSRHVWCRCGEQGLPGCQYRMCSSCCDGYGCNVHSVVHVGATACLEFCNCGRMVSADCDFDTCSDCCRGCSWHADVLDSDVWADEEESEPEPQAPLCSCGRELVRLCEFEVCHLCCRGCGWHDAVPDTESEPESDYDAPQPGEPGSCSCGQTASPSCENNLCASCCSGCSRHGHAATTGVQQQPAEPPPQPQPQQQQLQPQPQQQQPPRCICGRPAAQSCLQGRCGACCWLPGCARHAAARSSQEAAARQVEEGYDSSEDEEGEYDTFFRRFADLTLRLGLGGAAGEPRLGQGFGLRDNPLPAPGGGIGFVPVVEQPAGSIPLGPAVLQAEAAAQRGIGGAGSSRGAAAATDAARGLQHSRSDQQQTAAGAGAGPSSSKACEAAAAAAAAGTAAVPPGQAEEELFQLKHCVVCLDAPRSVLLLPCKHLVLCEGCMGRMKDTVMRDFLTGDSTQRHVLCPVCREPASAMLLGVILA